MYGTYVYDTSNFVHKLFQITRLMTLVANIICKCIGKVCCVTAFCSNSFALHSCKRPGPCRKLFRLSIPQLANATHSLNLLKSSIGSSRTKGWGFKASLSVTPSSIRDFSSDSEGVGEGKGFGVAISLISSFSSSEGSL